MEGVKEKRSGRQLSQTVFWISVVFCGAIAIWGIAMPQSMTGAARALTGFCLTGLGWFYLLLCTFFVIFSGYMAMGPYAHIKLGQDDEEPEFTLVSWLAMLFAAGMGAGLLFWGVAEPMFHFASPPGMQGGTPEAAVQAMVITNFHWGFHAWSIYASAALALAYFGFRKGMPSLVSTPIRAEFKDRWKGQIDPICHVVDVISVLAIIFGLAGSLALGILQINAGLHVVFEAIPGGSHTVQITLVILVSIMFMLSASTGLDKGIKILSNINMAIALLILLFVIFLGPTRFILEVFVNTFGTYVTQLFQMSFRLFPYKGLGEWTAGWTLTYLIWWVAWGPFVGVFIARISRGRTIRQFILGVVLIPTLFSVLWFAAFGGTAFNIELFGAGGLSDLIMQDVTRALFAFFGYFPFTSLLNILALFLIFVFLVTSADSGTFVVSMMTSDGDLNPGVVRKLTWGVIIVIITISTLLGGGVSVAKAIAITGAIPFSLIMVLQIIAFLRTIRNDPGKEAG
ncbi:MAG: BCCT family transporter [Desulfosarcinaceae bacterium]|nr:BCCT family transporter [Desulfosarcinaceae bacterium]